MASSVVKLRPDTYERVRQLARERHASMQEVIARGIDALERQEFAQGFQEDFAALRGDAEDWKAERAEREVWDSSLDDALDR